MKILLPFYFVLLTHFHLQVSGQFNLYNEISKIISQLQGRSTTDHTKILNFIKSNIARSKTQMPSRRRNNKFSQNLIPLKSFRRVDANHVRSPFVVTTNPDPEIFTLNSNCKSSADCPEETGQFCFDTTCQCNSKHVQVNATHCLPGALIGFGCEAHSQCQMRVKASSCIQGFCQCGAGFVPYRRANCLKGAKLDEKCRTNAQCRVNTLGSTCKWVVRNVLGRCQCDHRNPRRGNKCGPTGFALGAPCGRSFDCAQHVPGAICIGKSEQEVRGTRQGEQEVISSKSQHSRFAKSRFPNSTLSGTCQCPRGHLEIDNGTRCVPVQKEVGVSPVSLGKPCTFTSQCSRADPYSVCEDGICTCTVTSASCSATKTGCFNETFQCISDGRCMSADFVCNGVRECSDGSDELDCVPGRCSPLAFTCDDGSCVPRGKICDGKPHCPDGSDEKDCVGSKACPHSTFRCKNGQCLPGYTFCNAQYNCIDKSDEEKISCIGGNLWVDHCPFRCKNSRCRSAGVVCSGTDGCGDNSDEENCSVCSCPKPS